ncbi:ras-related protein rab-32 [Anaeramoeba flamelloides]|uniref:Ras-related protein rab-32 n=1 Tax=Anaeramoeba flamelloides TaxID=1746091 RepID=A0AAV7YD37_9EUKA|nr:ras-related protein rab-32 [Anaeramoeba flamelloides]
MSTSEEFDSIDLYKIIVVGSFATGKTSLIRRYCSGSFTPNYRITIGVDFSNKQIEKDNYKAEFRIFDIAGHERFSNLTRTFYKGASAGIVVCDYARPATLQEAAKWKNDIDNKVFLPNKKPIPVLLAINKCDLEESTTISDEVAKEFVQKNGFFDYKLTSAKENIGIDKVFYSLLDKLIEIRENVKDMRKISKGAFKLSGDESDELEKEKPSKKKNNQGGGCC